MIREPVRTIEDLKESQQKEDRLQRKSPDTVWSGWNIPREQRE